MHILRKQACWTAYVGLCLMLQQAGHKKRDHAATEELLTHAFGLEETLARQTGLPALQIINLAMATALAMTKAPQGRDRDNKPNLPVQLQGSSREPPQRKL